MVLLKQDNHACGLGVEGRRRVEEGIGDDLLDLDIGNKRLVLELVDGAAALDGLDEGG